ncbi:MAG: DNA primase small subunit domain-containing protein [archaeon]
MLQNDLFNFYTRKDILKCLLDASQDREVSYRYANGGFGKRPDILQFEGDIIELVKQGVLSFHISEERWTSPLDLQPGMTKRQLDELRKGWDLILDIDTVFWDYAKYTAFLLIEALKFHDVKCYSIKFSGSKGFHIAVPFEAFPDEVNEIKTKDLFPDGLRIIAAYLSDMIKEHLTAKIFENDTMENLCKISGKTAQELLTNGKFDPFKIIDIDTVLISNRHLFRAPYSLHEKLGLISVPINPNHVLGFEKTMAEIENIQTDVPFLDRSLVVKNEAKQFIIQAFDWHSKQLKRDDYKDVLTKPQTYNLPEFALQEEYFPNCIQNILKGGMSDGKKRSLFILVNFLRHVGWDKEKIKECINEWNERNPDKLKEGYIQSQIIWNFRQKQPILPPNCANSSYYKDLRLCNPANFCERFRNPVNFALKRKIPKKKKTHK